MASAESMGGVEFFVVCLVAPFVWGTFLSRMIGRADEEKRKFTLPKKPKTDYSI